jgi:probable HAF family extracellular repeat protein
VGRRRWNAASSRCRVLRLRCGSFGDGATVAGICLQINNTAFRLTGLGTDPESIRGSDPETAAAIPVDGAVIAGAGHLVLTGAVIWRADGSATVLGKLPGYAEAIATAASRDGSVVVGSSKDNTGNYHAFRWAMETGMVALGRDGDGFLGSFATSISGDGRMVVGWGTTAAGDVAMIWDAGHGLRQLTAALLADYRLQIEGWKLIRATSISGDGRTIAGSGTNPQGQTEAWIVKLPD